MTDLSRRALLAGLSAALGPSLPFGPARAAEAADASAADRLPRPPLVVDLAGRGRRPGTPGGTVRMLITRARDVRYLSVCAYTRLVGYDAALALERDRRGRVEPEGPRLTFHLREGHRWSDGQPFTTEDFRYYWEDVANNK